jgi:hypothetical protein
MTLQDVVDSGLLFQGIDVLCIVPEKLPMIFQQLDKVMTWTWREVTRKNLSCKRVENLGSFPKEV